MFSMKIRRWSELSHSDRCARCLLAFVVVLLLLSTPRLIVLTVHTFQYGYSPRLLDEVVGVGVSVVLLVFSLKKHRWALVLSAVWYALSLFVLGLFFAKGFYPDTALQSVLTCVIGASSLGAIVSSVALLRAVRAETKATQQ